MRGQRGGDSLHEGGRTVEHTLGNFVTHRDGAIVSLMATGLQIIENAGKSTPKDFLLTNEPSTRHREFGSR